MDEQGDLRALQKRQLISCAVAVFPTTLQPRNHLALVGDAKLPLRDLPVRRRSAQFADEPILCRPDATLGASGIAPAA